MTGAVSAFATGGWKGGVMSIVNTAASLLPPGMAQAAQVAIAAFGAVWKAIKRPSEEEIAARKSFQGIHDSAVETFGETAAYTESVQRLVAEGWDRTLAETVVGFEQAAAVGRRLARRSRRALRPVPACCTGREYRAGREHRGDLRGMGRCRERGFRLR